MGEERVAQIAREPITSGTRSNIVDIVKGIAISLVAYGHTTQGMIHRNWWISPGAYFSDTFIYSFHMPAFFFVAGLFVMTSLAKRGAKRFAIDKLKAILYPYVVFGILSAALEPLIGRFKLSSVPFHWNVFLRSMAEGEVGWFLFVLFICLMVALLTSRMPAWLRFLGAAFLGLIPAGGPTFIGQVLHEFCFVAAGMWVGTRIHRLEQIRASTAALGLFLLTAFQVAMIRLDGPAAIFQWTYIILGLTGTAGLFLLARLLDKHRAGDGIAWVGRASLGVFLMSAEAQGATREILLRMFHTQAFWLQLLVPTLFAILLPAIVWHQQDRLHIGWLFHWPSKAGRSTL